MALQRNIFVRYLIFSFAVLFALLRSTQYFHAEPLGSSGTGHHRVAKYQSTGQQLMYTRHMEKAVEERFTTTFIPAIQFNGIIFLLFCILPVVFQLKFLNSPILPFLQLSAVTRCTRLCVFRL